MTSFGFEPFTANNELRYSTLQFQDNFTKFTTRHSLTVGGYAEKYHSDNVFFSCCPQIDRRLPFGIVSTTEYIFARDINGMYYINANLPPAQSTFAGVDSS